MLVHLLARESYVLKGAKRAQGHCTASGSDSEPEPLIGGEGEAGHPAGPGRHRRGGAIHPPDTPKIN
jgi:hypothetical protein